MKKLSILLSALFLVGLGTSTVTYAANGNPQLSKPRHVAPTQRPNGRIIRASVPEPGTLVLFGAGLLSLAAFVTLRQRKTESSESTPDFAK